MAKTAETEAHSAQIEAFKNLLEEVLPTVENKARQSAQAAWLLETTGSKDAASLCADLETELKLILGNKERLQKAIQAESAMHEAPAELQRLHNVWLRSCKPCCIDPALLRQITDKETKIRCLYANFRPQLNGKKFSEEEIRDHLKQEEDPARRKQIWEMSKEIGNQLAEEIRSLAVLRNKSAKSLGYPDYFHMQLALQEVDGNWLMGFLEEIATRSDAAYTALVQEIETKLSQRFKVPKEELGPWAWADPFCQEDPLGLLQLDDCLKEIDICEWTQSFYARMGCDVKGILSRSDLYPREGKNQHAFCTHIDRKGDVRTLDNITQSMRWLETLLHELGHAIYEEGFDSNLPWLLREPPHMITTEAIALLMGRQAYSASALREFPHATDLHITAAKESAKRRQLIFSRWVLVMTAFEKSFYHNPEQDLNALWWSLVERYQKVKAPKRPEGQSDWAAKYHVGMAPVYYYSYLLGELFASSIHELCKETTGEETLALPAVGDLLKTKLFFVGNRLPWKACIEQMLQKEFSADAWIDQYAKN